MAYATVDDVQARMTRVLSSDERTVCATLLEDAALLIDAVASGASDDAKKAVSCRMTIRAMDIGAEGLPMGTTQASKGAGGYTESFTISSGGSLGELYLSKGDRRLLGIANSIGSYSPVQEMAT